MFGSDLRLTSGTIQGFQLKLSSSKKPIDNFYKEDEEKIEEIIRFIRIIFCAGWATSFTKKENEVIFNFLKQQGITPNSIFFEEKNEKEKEKWLKDNQSLLNEFPAESIKTIRIHPEWIKLRKMVEYFFSSPELKPNLKSDLEKVLTLTEANNLFNPPRDTEGYRSKFLTMLNKDAESYTKTHKGKNSGDNEIELTQNSLEHFKDVFTDQLFFMPELGASKKTQNIILLSHTSKSVEEMIKRLPKHFSRDNSLFSVQVMRFEEKLQESTSSSSFERIDKLDSENVDASQPKAKRRSPPTSPNNTLKKNAPSTARMIKQLSKENTPSEDQSLSTSPPKKVVFKAAELAQRLTNLGGTKGALQFVRRFSILRGEVNNGDQYITKEKQLNAYTIQSKA